MSASNDAPTDVKEERWAETTEHDAAEPPSLSRRGLIAFGGAAVGAGAIAMVMPAAASADDCDDVELIENSPVNAKLSAFWDGDDDHLGEALAGAIEYADTNGYGCVLAPAGSYVVDELEVPDGIRLTGEGPKTILTCAAPSATAVKLTGDGASLFDLRIEGDQSGSPSGTSGAVSVQAAGCTVRRVEIADARGVGLNISGAGESTAVAGCLITNPHGGGILGRFTSTVENDIQGVAIEGNVISLGEASSPAILFDGAGGSDGHWAGLRISGNSIDSGGGGTGIQFGELLGPYGSSVRDGTVSGNVISGMSTGLVGLGGTLISVVGNTFSGCNSGLVFLGGGDSGSFSIVGNTFGPGDLEDPPANAILLLTGGGYVVSGNTAKGHVTSIETQLVDSASITGNYIESTADAEVYELSGEETEDSTNYAGISIANESNHVVVVGNHIDGSEALPIGIKFQNTISLTCDGNLIRNCATEEEDGPTRDIVIRANDEARVDEGSEPRGAVVGNQGRVEISTGDGGAVGDLRVSDNRQDALPAVDAADQLMLAGLPEIVNVGAGDDIESIVNFYAGSTPEARSYPGRRVTLRFTDSLTVYDGNNLNLAGNFEVSPDSTLTLVCDGTNWNEVARTS